MYISFNNQFQTALTFANLIPFIQILVPDFEMIIQNLCLERLDEDHFS